MEELITQIMNQFGYLGVLLLILVENIFPPIPSEVILTFGGFATTLKDSRLSVPGVIIVSTIGSVIGALILYKIGTLINVKKIDKWLELKWVKRLGFKKKEVDQTVNFFDKYRTLAVLGGRCVPIIRSLISIPAGMTFMNVGQFLIYTTIGSVIWNTLLVVLGAKFGENWRLIVEFVDQYQTVVIVLGLIVAAFVVVKLIYNRTQSKVK